MMEGSRSPEESGRSAEQAPLTTRLTGVYGTGEFQYVGCPCVRRSQVNPAMGCATYGASNAVTSSLDS